MGGKGHQGHFLRCDIKSWNFVFQVDLSTLYMNEVVRGDTIDCFKGCIMHCNGFAILKIFTT